MVSEQDAAAVHAMLGRLLA
jgi:hypothetical protein